MSQTCPAGRKAHAAGCFQKSDATTSTCCAVLERKCNNKPHFPTLIWSLPRRCRSRFSGLTSRWHIPRLCRNASASSTCRIICVGSSKGRRRSAHAQTESKTDFTTDTTAKHPRVGAGASCRRMEAAHVAATINILQGEIESKLWNGSEEIASNRVVSQKYVECHVEHCSFHLGLRVPTADLYCCFLARVKSITRRAHASE